MNENGFNILIVNAHWNNRGDEAAIRAMIDSLRSRLPINDMKIMILSTNVNQFPYEDVKQINMYPISKISYIDSVLTLLTLGKLSLTRNGKQYLKAVTKSDLIIHAPGGPSIGDLYGGKVKDYPYLFRLLIALMKNKAIFFYAPSMGPFNNKTVNYFRKIILKKAKLIVVRENISAKYLKEQLNLDSYVTIDSAFQNKIPENYISKDPNLLEILTIIDAKHVVGITITDLKWHPKYKNYLDLSEQITDAISQTLEFLINKGYSILLIPQLFGEYHDTQFLSKFKKHRSEILILPEDVDSYSQQLIISKLFCVIGMRYHSNVFAAKQNVPFISIYYEHKMKGLMEKIELTDFMINVEDISFNQIRVKFIQIEESYYLIKNHLKIQTSLLEQESKKTTDLIIKTLYENKNFYLQSNLLDKWSKNEA